MVYKSTLFLIKEIKNNTLIFMKYIQKFNNHEDYSNKSTDYPDKLVSLCYNDAHIHFGSLEESLE
jgi:hypothetical protein